ncbi:MAG: ATP-binding cassette domain-containing protein [Bacilli bacterium]|nr:ATP-binding cassette domain-containing protein [Bacilli bacterium]
MEIIFNQLSYIENKKTSSEKRYFDEVNMIINSSSIVGIKMDYSDIIGELLMIIKRPTKGEIKIGDIIVKRTTHVNNINVLRRKFGIVPFENNVYLKKTVKDEIKNAMSNYGYKTKNISKHISDSLMIVGLDDSYLSREPNTLSYVEKKKVNLALAMSYNPEVLVIESFDKGLTFREREYFRKLFLKLKNKYNKTVILVNSELTFMFDVVDKLFVINKGRLVFSGDKDIFYEDKLYKYVEMPKIVEFIKYANLNGHNILEYTDIKELIKGLYRDVK